MCEWFGLTRQAYYQHFNQKKQYFHQQDILIQKVMEYRTHHKLMGTRKLYHQIKPFLCENNIKIGRDALFGILKDNKLLIRKRNRKIQTTYSRHWMKKYPNLIREFTPNSCSQLWVSDITYWKLKDEFCYISLITDAYSRKIVGYNLAKSLHSIETYKALKMALNELKKQDISPNLIHHSDRGSQYCERNYVGLLSKWNIKISMTENGDPLENAIAERINGILKNEYLDHLIIKDFHQAKMELDKAVNLYNNHRPHLSINYHYPNLVHQTNIKTQALWKNYFKKKTIFVNQV